MTTTTWTNQEPRQSDASYAALNNYFDAHDVASGARSEVRRLNAELRMPDKLRTLAADLVSRRGYATAVWHLNGYSDARLTEILSKPAGSGIPAHEQAGAVKYITERLG